MKKIPLSVVITTAIHVAEISLVSILCVFLILWAFEPLQGWMKQRLLINDSTVVAVVGVIALLLLKSLRELQNNVEKWRVSTTSTIVKGVSSELQQHLEANAARINSKEGLNSSKRRIDVFGFTLYASWTYISPMLLRGSFANGWRIQLFCLAPNFIKERLDVFDESWVGEVEHNIKKISDFLRDHADALDSRKIKISLRTYTCIPAVHGFLMGEDDIYISFSQWDAKGKVERPYGFYEHLPLTDVSDRAQQYRELFRNWYEHMFAHSSHVAGVQALLTEGQLIRQVVGRPHENQAINQANTADD